MKKLQYHLKNRTATWLELFFDLIFVILISKITHILLHTHDKHLEDELWWKFPLTLLPIWWIWMTHTIWSNLFNSNGPLHKLSTLTLMLLISTFAIIISSDWDKVYLPFVSMFVTIWIYFAFMFFTSSKHNPEASKYAKLRSVGMIISTLIIISSIFFEPPIRYLIVYTGLLIDLLTPIIITKFKLAETPTLHMHHFIERLGLLLIIVLGESILTLSSGLKDVKWDLNSISASISGIIMIYAIWWIYFDSYHRLSSDTEKLKTGFALGYSHFFTCLGLSTLAILIHHSIHDSLIRKEYQIMAASGMVFFYLGKQIPYFFKFSLVRKYIIFNSILTFLLSGLFIILMPSNSLILIGLTISFLVYVFLNFNSTLKQIKVSYK